MAPLFGPPGELSEFRGRYKWVALPSDIYFLEALPVKMQLLDFAAVVVIAVLLSYLGAMYPARRAARLAPVDAIREG